MPSQNRENRGKQRRVGSAIRGGQRAGAGELKGGDGGVPVARVGGGKRPVAGSRQQQEEGEKKLKRAKGGSHGQAAKAGEAEGKVLV